MIEGPGGIARMYIGRFLFVENWRLYSVQYNDNEGIAISDGNCSALRFITVVCEGFAESPTKISDESSISAK